MLINLPGFFSVCESVVMNIHAFRDWETIQVCCISNAACQTQTLQITYFFLTCNRLIHFDTFDRNVGP